MQRKKYSPEFKQQIIKEVREVGNGSIVARKHGISQTIVNRWFRQSRNNGFSHSGHQMPQDHKQILAENEQLKKLLGKKELEIEILRDLLKKTNPQLKIK
ncbi:MAG TPA: transposase [Bacillota bacterium]|nr:transposase [Bacillota bacterium]